MKDSTKVLAALIVMIVLFAFLGAHKEDVNNIPLVSVEGGGVSVDVGDFHYTSEGV